MNNNISRFSWIGVFNDFAIHFVILNIYLLLSNFLRSTVECFLCVWRWQKVLFCFLVADICINFLLCKVLFKFSRRYFQDGFFKSWSFSNYGILEWVQNFEIYLILVKEVLNALLLLYCRFIGTYASFQSFVKNNPVRPF